MAAATILLDDRLLVEELLGGLQPVPDSTAMATTTYWCYRACRAATARSGGHLSGPFEQVTPSTQRRAVASLLRLRPDLGLPDPRGTVPLMADLAVRHPRLNILTLGAVAAAVDLGAEVWLSAGNAGGLLPDVLDAEGLPWIVVATT